MEWSHFLLNPAVVWVSIPLAAILFGGIQQLVKMYLTHQERIALIEQGIDPDATKPHDSQESRVR